MIKKNKILIIPIVSIFIIFTFLWLTGISGLLIHGIGSIADNTKDFATTQGHTVQGKYSVSIDLADLKSNIGKELYHNGNYKIYVGWVDNTGSSGTGGYRIGFRSCGTYSLHNAILISGAHYSNVDDYSSTSDMSANMVATYSGKTYDSKVYCPGALTYKDGDEFAFYIFPRNSYDNGDISLNEKGKVNLTVTNIYENIWSKK